MELDKFWMEEIARATEALEARRVDPRDIERWKNYCASLEQTIDSWEVQYGFLLLCHALLNRSNLPFRMNYQVVMPKPYAVTMHARLRFVHSHFHFGISLD